MTRKSRARDPEVQDPSSYTCSEVAEHSLPRLSPPLAKPSTAAGARTPPLEAVPAGGGSPAAFVQDGFAHLPLKNGSETCVQIWVGTSSRRRVRPSPHRLPGGTGAALPGAQHPAPSAPTIVSTSGVSRESRAPGRCFCQVPSASDSLPLLEPARPGPVTSGVSSPHTHSRV